MGHIKNFAQIDYERLETFKSQGFDPKIIFDIGASNGGWSEKIFPLFPNAEFHLFEPLADIDSDYAKKLEKSLQANSSWKLHKLAVGNNNEVINFYRSKNSSYGSTSLKVQNSDNFEIFELQKVALDHMINASILPKPDFIKADIQGGELNILKGCEKYLPFVQLILLETWLSRGYGKQTPLIHEIINYLLPRGFYLFDVGDCYRNANNNLISQDFFFINRNSELTKYYHF